MSIGVGVVRSDQQMSRRCYAQSVSASETHKLSRAEKNEQDAEVEHKSRKEVEANMTQCEE